MIWCSYNSIQNSLMLVYIVDFNYISKEIIS